MRLATIQTAFVTAAASALLLTAAQAPAPIVAPTVPNAAEVAELLETVPVLELQQGTLANGITKLRELAESGELQAARLSADILLAPRGVASKRLAWWNDGGEFVRGLLDATSSLSEPLGWNGRPEAERAHVLIERGLVSLAPGERIAAEHDFGRALAVAPAGELREHAAYDLALLPLLEGEDWRSQIPELGGTPPPASPPANGAPPEEPPDPLEMAKGAYLEARARFIERLKLDWRDADTRANVELIQRRLRELAEIEQQREEQEQQQEQQQDGEENQDQEQQDSEQQDKQDQPEDGEQEPQDGEEGEQEQQPEEPQDGEESPEDSQDQENEAQQAEPQEVHLSQEELQRLLNRLAEHEKQAEALREMRRERGSRGVDKDW